MAWGPTDRVCGGPSVPASRQLHPVERLGDRLLPLRVFLRDGGAVHLRRPLGVLAPVGAEVVDVLPEPDREPGRVGGAERRGLGHLRPDHGHLQAVGLELHQQVVVDHAAVDLELLQLDAGVRLHGVEDLAGLPRGRLEGGPGDVALVDVAGHAHDRAARVAAPVRREQARERRHEVRPAVVLDRGGERLDVLGLLDQAQVVPQPLHQRARDGDRALEGVDRRRVAELPADGREQAALRRHHVGAGVQDA